MTTYLADCCTHQGADEHGCWDCYNTGHTHDADQPCTPEEDDG